MFRKVLLTSVLVCLAVGLILLSPWATRAEQPWAVFFTSLQRLGAAQERTQELDQQIALELDRVYQGNQVIEELVQGQLSLLEAASWWHQHHEASVDDFCPAYAKEASPEERACRQVIVRVKGSLRDGKESDRAKVLQRLETELRQLLAHPDRLVFSPAA